MIGKSKYGPVGLFGLPYNLLFEALGPIIEVCGYFVLVLSLVFGVVGIHFVVLFFLLAVGYGVFLSIAAILLDQVRGSRYHSRSDVARMLAFTVLENFGYRQMQAVWRAQATVDFLRKKQGWGEMRRRGFTTEAIPQEPRRTGAAAN